MTFKEENIVNIAMRAGELLKDGRIERDDISGHAGFTDTIVHLAEAFEQKYADVDFNAGDLDYWEEIDAFAEEQLVKEYGIDHPQEKKALDIKVIIDDGFVSAVLKNQNQPVNVEIVDVDRDYADYEKLDAYRNELCADKTFQDCDYIVAGFTEDVPELSSDERIYEPVTVYAHSGGGTSFALMSCNYDVCLAFCQNNNWEYVDENHFVWDLTLEDEREANFPVGFNAAVRAFSYKEGMSIDSELVRQNADKLVAALRSGLTFSDFKAWVQMENALREPVTLDEFKFFKNKYGIDRIPLLATTSLVFQVGYELSQYRMKIASSNSSKAPLNDVIAKASEKRTSPPTSSQKKDFSRGI